MKKVAIRGIEILAAADQQALLDFLWADGKLKTGRLVAINAEKVVLSEEDEALRALILQSEYPYADGISVVKSILKKYPQIQPLARIAGADLWLALMKKCAENDTPVYLLGAQADTLQQTSATLQAMGVKVVGQQDGYFAPEAQAAVIEAVKRSGADFVSVALGSPKQEKLIAQLWQAHPQALYMGVGGSYDVFVGKVKRAPISWQKAGLEWLYRLLTQPIRLKRQGRLLKYAYYYGRNLL